MDWYIEVLSKYATFSGRARRKEYWMFLLCNFGVSFFIGLMLGLARVPAATSTMITTLYTLATFIPSLAVAVRRLHDTNHSGWWLLAPIYNLVLLLKAGEERANPHGRDPKAPLDQRPNLQVVNGGGQAKPLTTDADVVMQLKTLAELKTGGHLTADEFEEKKKSLLAS